MASFVRWCLLCLGICVIESWVPCDAATVNLVVNESTGEVFLRNPATEPFRFISYSITSGVNALDSIGWTSIADNYDADGDSSVDADEFWVEFTAPGSSSDLSEGVFSLGDGGSIAPGGAVSLGLAWNTGSVQELAAEVIELSTDRANVLIDYRPTRLDFNGNGTIDAADFTVWRDTLGSTTDASADANADGIVDGNDYEVWRSSFGTIVVPLTIRSANARATIPEPTTATLIICLTGILRWPRLSRLQAPLQ